MAHDLPLISKCPGMVNGTALEQTLRLERHTAHRRPRLADIASPEAPLLISTSAYTPIFQPPAERAFVRALDNSLPLYVASAGADEGPYLGFAHPGAAALLQRVTGHGSQRQE